MWVNFGDYRCSRSVDFGDGTRCPGAVARGEQVHRAIAEGLQREILNPRRLKAVKAALTRHLQKEATSSSSPAGPGFARRIADLEKQIAEGIARIPLLPKSLVPDMAKGLDALRRERDDLKRQQRQATRPKGSKKSPVASRVEACIAAAYRLADTLQNEAPAEEVNIALRDVGVRVSFDIPRARVSCSLLDPKSAVKPEENDVLTCDPRVIVGHKSKSPGVIVFEVPIPAENKGKRKRRAG